MAAGQTLLGRDCARSRPHDSDTNRGLAVSSLRDSPARRGSDIGSMRIVELINKAVTANGTHIVVGSVGNKHQRAQNQLRIDVDTLAGGTVGFVVGGKYS